MTVTVHAAHSITERLVYGTTRLHFYSIILKFGDTVEPLQHKNAKIEKR